MIMARSYKRDSAGRFAGGGSSGGGRKASSGGKAPKPPAWSKAMKQAKGKASSTGTKRSPAKAGGSGKPAKKGGSTLWKGREGQALRTANRVAAKLKQSKGKSGRAQVSAATAMRAASYLKEKARTGKEPARPVGGMTANANRVAFGLSQKRRSKFSGKAPVSKAKQAYRAATGKAREARMLAGGAASTRGLGRRTDPGAQNIRRNVKAAQAAAAKVRKMERNRGVSKPRKRK